MIVVSLGVYTALCIFVGFFAGGLFATIFYVTKPEPIDWFKAKEYQVIPSGSYIVKDGRLLIADAIAERE